MKVKYSIFLLLCLIISGAWGCRQKTANSGGQGKESQEQNVDTSLINSQMTEVYYRFPSPNEVFNFVKDAGLKYQPGLINPAANADKYLESRSQSLNLGVYAADLAYIVIFGKSRETMAYFIAIQTLTDKTRIKSAYDQSLIKRIEKNLNNLDSLREISTKSYYSIVDHLVENGKEKTLALISSGAYIECLYIALSSAPKYSEKNLLIQRIAEQKYAFDNLYSYVEQYKQDENASITLDYLRQIKVIFDELKEQAGQTKVKQNANGSYNFEGGNKLIITEAQYALLKTKVLEIRKKMTGNVSN
jgi:hypothetical protein